MNQTLTEYARRMRLQADMSEGFWAETVSHVSYLVDRSPSIALIFKSQKNITRRVNGLFNLINIRMPDIQFG